MNTARTFLLILASISFVVMIGGATYEHAGVVPVWSAAMPASLAMFQGEYALAASRFWIPVHPISISFMIAALIANWRTERQVFILVPIFGYAAVLLTTFLWFVPELIAITGTIYSPTINEELTRRGETWETLSLIRLVFLTLLAIVLLFGLSRSAETKP